MEVVLIGYVKLIINMELSSNFTTASEAAELTIQNSSKVIEKINDLIEKACEEGKAEIFVNKEDWTSSARLLLRNANYQVSENPIRNGNTEKYCVSWEHSISTNLKKTV